MSETDQPKKGNPSDDHVDALKSAARGLEKSLGGAPISVEVADEVIKALKDCKDVPEPLLKGLTLVVASNVVNCREQSNNSAGRIFHALLGKDRINVLNFFVKSLVKVRSPVPINSNFVACKTEYQIVRWLLTALIQTPKAGAEVNDELLGSIITTVASTVFRLPEKFLKPTVHSLCKALDKYSLDSVVRSLEVRLADEPWQSLAAASLLVAATRQTTKSSDSSENAKKVASLWWAAFQPLYLQAKSYPGDRLYEFADGFEAFVVLPASEYEQTLQSSLRKLFLRTPELALPLLKVITSNTFPINQTFADFVAELLLDVTSSNDEKIHDEASKTLAKLWIHVESKKRSQIFEKMFGKQSKLKNKTEYFTALQHQLLHGSFENLPALESFAKDLIDFSEKELTASKSDHVSQTALRNVLALCKHHIQQQKSLELAQKYTKTYQQNPLAAAVAVQILGELDQVPENLTQLLKDVIATGYTQPAINADFVFASTVLLFKLAIKATKFDDVKPLLLSVLAHEVYGREKFWHHLTAAAIEKSSDFVTLFFDAIAKLGPTDKLPESSHLLNFVYLLLHWNESKASRWSPQQLVDKFVNLNVKTAAWAYTFFAKVLNNGSFLENSVKVIDVYDPHNLVENSSILTNSLVLKTIPSVVANLVVKDGISEDQKIDFVYDAVLLANNSAYQYEWTVSQSAENPSNVALLKTIFDGFESKNYLSKLLSYEVLKSRQLAIGWLVSIESENAFFRDFFWNKCAEYSKDLNLKALCEVEEKEANVFFTPEGTLYNQQVIDDASDFGLDGKHNLKRENKAYKFKDQVAEIELRKELAEKNKREGKLTPKQQEAVKKELAKESTIRKELRPFYDAYVKLSDLLPVVVKSDPNGALKRYSLFHDVVIPSLQSNLVRKEAFACVEEYKKTFFAHSSDFLGERALSALLRSVKSVSNLSEWAWEPLLDQVSKLFTSLNLLCMMNTFLDDENPEEALEMMEKEEDNEDFFNEGLTLGKVAFVLPVIERVFNDAKVEDRLRREATAFLKSAFALDFLTAEERTWPPLNILNRTLLDVLARCENLDYFEDLFNLLKEALKELNDNNRSSPDADAFVSAVIDQLRNVNSYVREHIAVLLAICRDIILESFVNKNDAKHVAPLLISSQESHENAAQLMELLCQELRLEVTVALHDTLIEELQYPHDFWQIGVSHCLTKIFTSNTVKMLDDVYEKLLQIIPAVHDNVGREIAPERDPWDSRRGIAFLFKEVGETESYDMKLFDDIFNFLVPKGISEPHGGVRKIFYDAAATIVSDNGAKKVDFVLPLLESYLLDVPDTQQGDILRNGLVCLMGTLARYLDPGTPKMNAIFERLIDTLSTPSRQVQESVSLCLPPLAKPMGDVAVKKLDYLFEELPKTKNYAQRCGYAFGIAGLTKGLGLVSLRDTKFVEKEKAFFESKETNVREGACLLFLAMSYVHGKSFDPYVSKILQFLINAFGDAAEPVRQAAREAGAIMMSAVTPAGVKVFLPQILAGLDQEAWRTKCASADFLANISNCAPRQLSESLPKVVPRLSLLMTDSHAKVRASGVAALKQIATVITNPEILAISPHMIAAFVEPAKETTRALTTIVNTKFVHFIDPPALALMMPILKRALLDRDPNGRRMAANVVTNVFSIADEKDIAPYMDIIVPNVKHSLLDPSPEVRSAAAQAIGAVVRHNTTGLFTQYTSDLIPWLKEHMMSKSSMVDRLGAAQGLAEVIPAFASGVDMIMDHAIKFTECVDNDPAMRDGYIRLFTYLPSTMGDKFIAYIERVIPSILSALADETEYLRQSALHSGQILIKTYCSQAKRLLLPSLLDGVLNEEWRIRHAAVTLIGDFLFNISGISTKMTSDTATEDDTFGMESVNKTIVKFVGQKSRDRIIVSLYMARFDCAVQVRQAASHVWKLVVPNTPRTVKESLPALYNLAVYCLATSTEDRRHMGVECISEVVRKMGDRIMDLLIVEVQQSFENQDTEHRVGAADVLTILIQCANSENIEEHSKIFLNVFRRCILDSDVRVRETAANAFCAYYNKIGLSAIEEFLDPLFNEYIQTQAEEVLDAVVSVFSVNKHGRALNVPDLVKRVLTFPRRFHFIGRLTEVIPDLIGRQAVVILEALLKEPPTDEENPLELQHDVFKIVKCCSTSSTAHSLVRFAALRAGQGYEMAGKLLVEAIKNSHDEEILEDSLCYFIETIMPLYQSEDPAIAAYGIEAMTDLATKIPSAQIVRIPELILTQFLARLRSKKFNGTLPGLGQPGGWKPFVEIVRTAAQVGTMGDRGRALNVVTDLMDYSDQAAIRANAPLAIGVILRILMDRCDPIVKLNAIKGVDILLDRAPETIRMFSPQLISFLLKAFQKPEDASAGELSALRERCASAISRVVYHHPRQETGLQDLIRDLYSAELESKPTVSSALTQALILIGDKVSDDIEQKISTYCEEYLCTEEDRNEPNEYPMSFGTLYGIVKAIKGKKEEVLSGRHDTPTERPTLFWKSAVKAAQDYQ